MMMHSTRFLLPPLGGSDTPPHVHVGRGVLGLRTLLEFIVAAIFKTGPGRTEGEMQVLL